MRMLILFEGNSKQTKSKVFVCTMNARVCMSIFRFFVLNVLKCCTHTNPKNRDANNSGTVFAWYHNSDIYAKFTDLYSHTCIVYFIFIYFYLILFDWCLWPVFLYNICFCLFIITAAVMPVVQRECAKNDRQPVHPEHAQIYRLSSNKHISHCPRLLYCLPIEHRNQYGKIANICKVERDKQTAKKNN